MSTPFNDVAAEHALFNTKSRQKIQQTEFMMSAPTFVSVHLIWDWRSLLQVAQTLANHQPSTP
ncbi:hypothetical protein [Psychrobacter sp. JCM 18900]|uniref:hypothetical protein n=1 Tax=Psychrobacter sp. JCM 18900 TaxID=1298608 RepID=UPI0026889039